MTVSISGDTAAPWQSLADVPLLAALPDDQLRLVWAKSLQRRLRRGDVLRYVGDPADHLVLLLQGRVSATVSTSAGRVVRFGEWTGPCALDKVAVIDGRGHTATLTATASSTVRSLPRTLFEELIDDLPLMRRHVLRALAEQARRQQDLFADTTTMRVEARLATWLLSEMSARQDTHVELQGPQQTLADLLGTTRVTVNRALSQLRHDGLIDVSRRSITVLAPELLALRVTR